MKGLGRDGRGRVCASVQAVRVLIDQNEHEETAGGKGKKEDRKPTTTTEDSLD